MCELPYRRAEPSHPLRQGGRNTGHGEGVKTVAAVESTARQVPSVVPHGMTSSCGCMAPCGWPQPSPLHPATPYSVRSQGQLPRCPMTLLMRWTSHECLHLPQCLSYPLTACGSMSDANTARAAGCLGTVPGANPICIKLSYLTCSHGFKPRARPPYRAHIPQAVGDSCGVSFFAYTATWGALA